MNDDTKTQVKFVASQEDVERWRADAKEAGLSFSEHVRRRLDLSVGPVAVPDPDPPEQPSVQAGEDWTTCEAPDCEIPVQGRRFCFAHRAMADSPFLPRDGGRREEGPVRAPPAQGGPRAYDHRARGRRID